ncbi:hypothetical protein D3C72_1495720 [compost metagenome]
MIVVPVPGLIIDWFANGTDHFQGREIMLLYPLCIFLSQRTNSRRCCIELCYFMFFNYIPEAVRLRVRRYSFKDNRCSSIQQRAVYNIGVTGDPADICRTPVDIIFFIIKYILECICSIHHIARTAMHHALGLTGRTGCVQDKQRIFSIHDLWYIVDRCGIQ